MRATVGVLVLAVLPLGCSMSTPAPPAALSRESGPPAAGGAPSAAPEMPVFPQSPPGAPPPAPARSPAAPKGTTSRPGKSVPSPSTPIAPPAPNASAPAPEPPPTAAPAPPSSPPVVSPRVDNEEKATREVNARLARAGQVIDQIDSGKLAKEQREVFSSIRDFISKASEALQAKDVPRAQILADKASKLADDLALALKNAK